ncbi:hypothetical protein [Pseudomonas sp. PLMAX]|uniref:hypothetical protein n=1 Tax=Pseudomonas sp. PLMAX TaxID=2201998 RepID=UPI0038B9C93B
MDDQAKAELVDWLIQQGFTGSLESLTKKMGRLHLDTRSRLAWMIWESRFAANKEIVAYLRKIHALGEKHFEHSLITADYSHLGSMDFSTPKPEYVHRAIKAITVALAWAGRGHNQSLEVRIIFRYAADMGIRDRCVTFNL